MGRKILVVAAALALLLIAGSWFGREQIVGYAIRERLKEQPDLSWVQDREHVRVLLCGTGSPEVSAARAQACTLVAAGGRMFLFDAGDGAVRSLARSNIPVNQLSGVFITHFHSDHFNDLAPLINASWIWGRQTPLEVTGPVGLNGVVAGLAQAYALDEQYRSDNMPHLAAVRAVARARPKEVLFPDGQRMVRVYDEGGVTIDATLVAHDPVRPALGYVLRYRGKKVFITGDTEVSPVNLPAMHKADLVVHEAYATHLVRQALPQMRAIGKQFEAEVAERTLPYHADTIALARQAQQAGVRHLVLTHLIPYPGGFVLRRMFAAGMADLYDGQLTVGRDGEVIVL